MLCICDSKGAHVLSSCLVSSCCELVRQVEDMPATSSSLLIVR
jgi:hypothetical protein